MHPVLTTVRSCCPHHRTREWRARDSPASPPRPPIASAAAISVREPVQFSAPGVCGGAQTSKSQRACRETRHRNTRRLYRYAWVRYLGRVSAAGTRTVFIWQDVVAVYIPCPIHPVLVIMSEQEALVQASPQRLQHSRPPSCQPILAAEDERAHAHGSPLSPSCCALQPARRGVPSDSASSSVNPAHLQGVTLILRRSPATPDPPTPLDSESSIDLPFRPTPAHATHLRPSSSFSPLLKTLSSPRAPTSTAAAPRRPLDAPRVTGTLPF
ncbi:hypothetical protein FA95DRAFT_220976 [Auriscalpium vulgare]|uniref:Uncharacterized protein n=1 Tax=Auriscalpium vulgare TaxID=40419 RepID=A0ACB8RKH5_9AGAM|nr:hypothetical protein FA95DRAFT_220976 [Auriscalpium vulgare]